MRERQTEKIRAAIKTENQKADRGTTGDVEKAHENIP